MSDYRLTIKFRRFNIIEKYKIVLKIYSFLNYKTETANSNIDTRINKYILIRMGCIDVRNI